MNRDRSGSRASFATGIWTILAAMVLLFFGMFIVLFTCFSARKARKNATYKTNGDVYNEGYNGTTTAQARTTRKKRFGLF